MTRPRVSESFNDVTQLALLELNIITLRIAPKNCDNIPSETQPSQFVNGGWLPPATSFKAGEIQFFLASVMGFIAPKDQSERGTWWSTVNKATRGIRHRRVLALL